MRAHDPPPAAEVGACRDFDFLGIAGRVDAVDAFVTRAVTVGASTIVRDPCMALLAMYAATTGDETCREAGAVCVAAGEVYVSDPAVGSPPARLACRAYASGGSAAWAGLEGQFSLALWDTAHRELLLYRDATGASDLFHAGLEDGTLVFSTRSSLLLALLPTTRAIRRRALQEFLRFLDISPPNTIYAGVASVLPGSVLRWHEGATSSVCPPIPEQPRKRPPAAFERATDELSTVLKRAVAQRIPDAGDFASFLSGGLDSGLICALAKAQAGDRVEAVTVAFEQAGFDESAVASRVAGYLGIRHRILSFSLDDYHHAFGQWVSSLEAPYADPAGLPTFLAYREVRRHHAVALDGTGSDTLFGIMPARHVRFATQYAARLPRAVRRLAARLLQRFGPLGGYRPLFDFDEPEELLIRWRGWERQQIESLMGERVSFGHTRFYQLYAQFPSGQHLERYSRLIGSLPDDRVFRSAARTGLKVRLPFLSPAVQDFVRSLPVDYRYRPREPKRILRALFGRCVPPGLWDVPKHGFDFPLIPFLRHRNCALVREHLDRSRPGIKDLLSRQVVDDSVASFVNGDDRIAFRIWALLVLEAWYQRLGDEGGESAWPLVD